MAKSEKNSGKPVLLRIATVPSLFTLQLKGQAVFMQQAGFEVHWVSGAEKGWIKWPVNENPDAIHQIIFSRKADPIRDILTLLKLYGLLRRVQPDIVHSHTPKGGLLGMWAAKLAGIKIRVHTIAGTPYSTAKGLKKWMMRYAEQATAFAATEVWVNSPLLLENLIKAQVLPKDKCKILGHGASNGVNLEVFNRNRFNGIDEQEFRTQFKIEAHHKILLFVGRVVSEKGIRELVDAFCQFYENNTDYKLVLIGPYEPERDSIPAETIYKIESHTAILYLPWSNDIPIWMVVAKAFILPSYREGLANVLLEAAAMRCLLMVSSIDGNLNLVPDENFGILFASRSTEALYSAMLNLLSLTEADYIYRTNNLYKVVKAHYSQQRVHTHLANAYQRLLRERGH